MQVPTASLLAGGQDCSACHSATLKAAHATTSTSGGSVTCVECHTDTTLDSSATVAASWPTRKCVECHDYGASTTHDSYATTHTVEPGTCAGTGAGCHDFTDLSALHAVSQSGGAPTYQGCANADPSDPSACHSVLDARPAAIDPAASCGEGTSGCHQDMNTSNHGSATAHGFSAASDYDNGTVTGCTNSGAGCHGTETTYSSFVDYHPASGCTTGPCHTSADKATFTVDLRRRRHVCGLPRRQLRRRAGRGRAHFGHARRALQRDDTHTGWMFDTSVTAGGTASATCSDCHSPLDVGGMGQLYHQHQALPAPYNDTTCSDCHNANANVSAVVTTGWPARDCTSCHTLGVLPTMAQHGSAPVVNGTVGTYQGVSCVVSGCHATSDLHELHQNAAGGCSLTGCHDYALQAAKPTATSCGAGQACHTGEPHLHLSSLHDGSAETMPQPGVSTTTTVDTVTVDNQTFPNATWPAAWTRSNTTYVALVNTAGRTNGTYAVQMRSTSGTRRNTNFYRDYDLSGYQDATLSFWTQTSALSGGADFTRVEYSTNGGANWTQIYNVTAATPASIQTLGIPAGGTVRVRFSGSYNNNTAEYSDFDDIWVQGTSTSTVTTPLPVGSSSAVSCQDNPNGTECHVVSDVAALHTGTAAGCVTCHNLGVAVNNCQTAGCHTPQYINNLDHDTSRHQSIQISTAAGEAFAGTGLTSATCTGCHDDGIDDEHRVLTSYLGTPCSMCHSKTTDSGLPTGVTAADTAAAILKSANTALCTDCHKTVTKTAPHVQRAGDGGTPGTQFSDTWSGHKVYSSGLGSGTSFANIQGATRTWPLPTGAWLSTGWTAASQVSCSDCHGSVTGATGPHGSSMQINYAIRTGTTPYDNSYSSGALTLNNGSMSNTTNLCAKCHPQNLDVNGDPHGVGSHNIACISCHARVPHAWKRPRLIGYTSDPLPYASTQVNSIRAKSYDPNANNWQTSDCGAGCSPGRHPQITGTSLWP